MSPTTVRQLEARPHGGAVPSHNFSTLLAAQASCRLARPCLRAALALSAAETSPYSAESEALLWHRTHHATAFSFCGVCGTAADSTAATLACLHLGYSSGCRVAFCSYVAQRRRRLWPPLSVRAQSAAALQWRRRLVLRCSHMACYAALQRLAQRRRRRVTWTDVLCRSAAAGLREGDVSSLLCARSAAGSAQRRRRSLLLLLPHMPRRASVARVSALWQVVRYTRPPIQSVCLLDGGCACHAV